ncbi:MAG: atpH [Candidatus Saccharibacteria bacterium]|nr:atpH [Candidatus Saccharibacteria bacterium]
MATAKLSRRKIAAYFADEVVAGRSVVKPLAAYLIESKRIREQGLIVRDIEAALADRGILFADVTSSYNLADDTKKAIQDYLKDKTKVKDVHLRTDVDESLLGGVRIETPDQRLDATLRHRLNQLTASKI